MTDKPIGNRSALKPITHKTGDNWTIAVYPHPTLKHRFSYSLTIDGTPRPNPIPIHDHFPYLFGSFSTPVEALSAAQQDLD